VRTLKEINKKLEEKFSEYPTASTTTKAKINSWVEALTWVKREDKK